MNLDRTQLRKLRGLILYTIVVAVLCFHYREVLAVAENGLHMVLPFLVGGAIAFILNVPMRKVESWIRGKGEKKKWHRPASLLAAVFLVAGILAVVLFVVAPEIVKTVDMLRNHVPLFAENLGKGIEKLFADEPDIAAYIAGITIDWNGVFNEAVNFLKMGAGSVLSTTFEAAKSIVSGITTFGIGFVFAIYILLQKETLSGQFTRFLQAFLPQKTVARILETAALTERTFSNFLAGQCMEAVILGTMFFLSMTILQMKYALLMGVLIAFTALIPIFGAFIGCAVGVFLMLMENPMSALAFFILFQVLQQIEGNLIYPHVVGGSVGLPSIWVLVAVTVGGSLMGVVGMLIFIPVCSVLYCLLKRTVHQRLRERTRQTDQ